MQCPQSSLAALCHAEPANRSAASKIQYFEEAGPLHLNEYLRIVEVIDILLDLTGSTSSAR
jgi:hypothetical protein